jgi:hypothetical protein
MTEHEPLYITKEEQIAEYQRFVVMVRVEEKEPDEPTVHFDS